MDENEVFLTKYDLKPNSVFDKNDFEALKNDLIKFAEIDFDTKHLSNSEFMQLYNSKVDEKHREYSFVDFDKKIQNAIDEFEKSIKTNEPTEQPVEYPNSQTPMFTEEQLARIEKYKTNPDFGKYLDELSIHKIINFNEEQLKDLDNQLANLFNTKQTDNSSDVDEKSSAVIDIIHGVDIAKTKEQRILRDKLLSMDYDVFKVEDFMMNIPQERQKTFFKLLDKYKHIIETSEYGTPSIKLKHTAYALQEIFSQTDEKSYQQALHIINSLNVQKPARDLKPIKRLCQETLTQEQLNKAIDLIQNTPDLYNTIFSYELINIIKLPTDKYLKAYDLYTKGDYRFCDDITLLVDFDYKHINEIKDFMHETDFLKDVYILPTDICKLNEEEFKHFKNLYQSEIKTIFKNENLLNLTKCSPEGIKNMLETHYELKKNDKKIPLNTLVFLAQVNDPALNKFVSQHPEYNFNIDSYKFTIDITKAEEKNEETETNSKPQYKTMRYNGNTKSFEYINEKYGDFKKNINATNQKAKREQHTKYTANIGEFKTKYIINSQKIRTYDNDNKLLKTEIYEPSAILGLPNITEFDKNGNKKILQQVTIDPYGNTKIIKDFTSFDGTRTQVQSLEDNLGNKRQIYKITDKNNNVLFNRVQTYTILGENKFLTTRNGEAHQIEYEGLNIKITNLQTKKSTTISLEGKIDADNPDTIMNIIKKMPAEQLLIMNLDDIKMFSFTKDPNVDTQYLNNAYWSPAQEQIFLGEHSDIENQKEFITSFLSTMFHEYGHFINTASKTLLHKEISENPELQEIFEREFHTFQENATTEEENFIEYFSTTPLGPERAAGERTAETTMLINTMASSLPTRAYYLQRYLPQTVAANANEIAKVEELALQQLR